MSGTALNLEQQSDLALSADDLHVATTAGKEILHGVSFSLQRGRMLALVGESGSGKTTAGLACLGYFRTGLKLTAGSVVLSDGTDVLALPDAGRRALRGGSIAYVPQDPALSLNPAMRIGAQITEVLQVHGYGASEADRRDRLAEVLADVGLPNDEAYQRRWPHELSGGQQQRVGIAMAFAFRPEVMIMDEPTTGLDVTTQALVLETLHQLVSTHAVAGLYITHDLAVVSEVADEVVVLLAGRVVEQGPCAQVLHEPQHEYTRKLLRAVPDLAGRRRIGEVAALTGAITVVDAQTEPVISTSVRSPSPMLPETSSVLTVSDLRLSYGDTEILSGIDLELGRGESLMLLGESGSGKTTAARCIAGLNDSYTGSVSLDGQTLQPATRQRSAEERHRIQYVFQSPLSSLNPRRTIGESVEVPLHMSGALTRRQRRVLVLEALEQVQLTASFIDRRPGELSGGERQRAAIARALVNAPSVLVCDEVTSALDVSVQASIIDLLRTLQLDTGMAMVFVTHNIALARHISQRLAVLHAGRIVDIGTTDEVLENPQHSYTRELLTHIPAL